MDDLLRILQENARESVADMARMLGTTEADVRERMADLERKGLIRGYQAIIHEDMLGGDRVTALIEVKVIPEREDGFDKIARRIAMFPEVRSLYLVSGTFDLLLFVQARTLHEVASFVSGKLASLAGVTSTCSHFMLKTYKHRGLLMDPPEEYERLKVSP